MEVCVHTNEKKSVEDESPPAFMDSIRSDSSALKKTLTFMNSSQIQRSNSFERLLTFECKICFCDIEGDVFSSDHHQCTSTFCAECVAQHCKTQIDEGTFDINCPCSTNNERFLLEYNEVMNLLDPQYKEKYTELSLKKGTMSMKDHVYCPKPGCSGSGFVDPCSSYFLCPECNTKVCPNCQEDFHRGLTCKQRQVQKLMESGNKEAAMTELWKQSRTKKCPNCNVAIEKTGGCAHMTCRYCKFEFCWVCMEKYYDGHIRQKHPNLHVPFVTPQEQMRRNVQLMQLYRRQQLFMLFRQHQLALQQQEQDGMQTPHSPQVLQEGMKALQKGIHTQDKKRRTHSQSTGQTIFDNDAHRW